MIDIVREDTWKTPPAPRTWRPVYFDGKDTARFTCANGHSGLLDDHDINGDGEVSPSVVCPGKDCDFHEYIKLVGWFVGVSK